MPTTTCGAVARARDPRQSGVGFRILEHQHWTATAVSTDSRPICTFCSAYDFHTIRIGHDPPFEDWYCQRHIKDGEGSRMCTMFSREVGSDDE